MSDFHQLVEGEIPRLRRYARALTRSADRADDLVQDTLVRAIAKAHLWQPGTDIRAWLFTIMHNQHVNLVRRDMREEATVDVDQLSSSLVATTDPTGARQLRELEKRLAVSPKSSVQSSCWSGSKACLTRPRLRSSGYRSAPCARACRVAGRRYAD